MVRCPYALMMAAVLLCGGQQPPDDDGNLKANAKQAIIAGLEYLKRTQKADGTWGTNSPTDEKAIATAALCGKALLENGVPETDESVRKVYRLVREAVEKERLQGNDSQSLVVMFLDRYHKERIVRREGQVVTHQDSKLILNLIEKILAGQASDGRWYDRSAGKPITLQALMALWVARKYSKSQELSQSISRCAARFRATQQVGGGWSEHPSILGFDFAPTGNMTCAGLIALGLHESLVEEQKRIFDQNPLIRKLNEDPASVRARAYLKATLELHLSGDDHKQSIAFLWALQNTATIYKWRRIDGMDWFERGARFLLRKKSSEGCWLLDQQSGIAVETAYALLYLIKSQLFGDLYYSVIGGGQLSDRPPQIQKRKEDSDTHAIALLKKLLAAPANEQSKILMELQEGKGGDYTDALVVAIKKLPANGSKEAARATLAIRFQRLSIKNITSFFEESERELRLAAVMAIRAKGKKADQELIKHIIPLLSDSDPHVAAAAKETYEALK
jgi:hypothetical protein